MSSSSEAGCAATTSPPSATLEMLAQRLLALRTEIDIILTELAQARATTLPSQTETASQPIERAAAPQEPDVSIGDQGCMEAPATEVATPTGPPIAEIAIGRLPDQAATVTADQPIAGSESQPNSEPRTEATPEAMAATAAQEPIINFDADPAADTKAVCDDGASISPIVRVAGPQAQLPSQTADNVVAMTPRASDREAQPDTGPRVGPTEGVAAIPGSRDAAATAAPVLSFDARPRKHKAELGAGSGVRGRTGRRVATRIAASILALITAATLLAVVDRAAQGGVPQPPPWLPPLPSSAPWPFFSHRQAAEEVAPTRAEIGGFKARAAAPDDQFLTRYIEAWPAGS